MQHDQLFFLLRDGSLEECPKSSLLQPLALDHLRTMGRDVDDVTKLLTWRRAAMLRAPFGTVQRYWFTSGDILQRHTLPQCDWFERIYMQIRNALRRRNSLFVRTKNEDNFYF